MAETDFIRLVAVDGSIMINAVAAEQLGITSWLPPAELLLQGFPPGGSSKWTLESASEITDEQIARMPNVARGAQYRMVLE